MPGQGNRPGGDRPGNRPSWDDPGRFNNRQDWVNDRRDHRGDRRNDLQNRMDQNRDNWQDWRNDRWDNRNDIREDWQDWAGNRWNDHAYWNHGCWGGHWDNWWHHMWDQHPVAFGFGLTAWGLNRLNYWFGYSNYYNPYYYQSYPVSDSVVIDYSQPLTVYEQAEYAQPAATAPTAAPPATTAPATEPSADPGMAAFEEGRTAFIAGNYDAALKGVNAALSYRPDDATLHEFRALIMFATGQYRDAAAGLNAVLAVGPGWDWTTLSGLYSNMETYTEQLRKLEDYTKQHPQASDARFVLAYHYITCGHTAAAAQQLQKVVAANPRDEVATQMLQMVAGPDGLPGTTPAPPPVPTVDRETPRIPAADLAGTWTASGADIAKFELKLTADGNFTWTFSVGGKQSVVEGIYVLDGADLVLQPDVGGVMLATITPPKDGGFHFQSLGGGPDDKGLDFRKAP
ncbi:MAG: tetratricopeptide repeat protein [Planctomycetaceae bacterium]